MPDEFITLSSLGTFSGTVFTVTIISQFLKGYVDAKMKIPTRLMVLMVSWMVLLGYRYTTTGHLPPAGLFVDMLNGFLVALAAMGAHSLAKDHLSWQ